MVERYTPPPKRKFDISQHKIPFSRRYPRTVFSVLVGSAMLILWSRPIYDIFFREHVEGRQYIRVGEKPALTPSESR